MFRKVLNKGSSVVSWVLQAYLFMEQLRSSVSLAAPLHVVFEARDCAPTTDFRLADFAETYASGRFSKIRGPRNRKELWGFAWNVMGCSSNLKDYMVPSRNKKTNIDPQILQFSGTRKTPNLWTHLL